MICEVIVVIGNLGLFEKVDEVIVRVLFVVVEIEE